LAVDATLSKKVRSGGALAASASIGVSAEMSYALMGATGVLPIGQEMGHSALTYWGANENQPLLAAPNEWHNIGKGGTEACE
jgi:hypothetical protein